MAASIGTLAALIVLGGCCLTAVSGGTGNYGVGAASTGASGGSSTGAVPSTTTGGLLESCQAPATFTGVASYRAQTVWKVVSADLNGDGLLDLIATNTPNPGLEVLFGLSDGGLGTPREYPESDGLALVVGDLNRDGLPDVVTSNQSALQILMNDGMGGLSPSAPITLEGVSRIDDIAIADFNGDGLADLLVGEERNKGGLTIVVFVAQSAGDFVASGTIPGIGTDWLLSTDFLVSDLNADGLPDIVADVGSQLAVFLNQVDGGFETKLYPFSAINQLVVLPRTGRPPDLAFGLASPPGGDPSGLQVLQNSGLGAFSVGPFYPGRYGDWLTVGDFNGDCIPDIAAAIGSGCPKGPNSNVSVFFGTGDGGFEAPVSLSVSANDAAGIAVLGSVGDPRAFAVVGLCEGGVTVYGDASKP